MNQTLIALLFAAAPAVLVAQLPEYVPLEGLEFWSDFDGDAENESLQSVSSSIYGAQPTTNRNGETNQALTFDGQDDYVLLYEEEGGISFGESLTLAAWVRPASSILNGTHSRIFNSTEGVGGGPDRWLFTWSPPEHEEKMQFQVDPSGSNGPYGSTPLTVGEWSHVAMVFDEGQVSFYHNGVADGSTTIANNSLAHVLAPIQIGSANANSFFHGDIDDIGIWSQTLTASQIETLSEAEINACVPPLEIQDVTVLSTPTSRYADDGVIAVSISTGQAVSLSMMNLSGLSAEVIPFTSTVPEIRAGIYAVSIQDSDGCSSDTLTVMLPYELCCECGVGDVDTDGICDNEDNCFDKRALNFSDAQNLDCVILGCTDPEYLEFDSSATDDDGTCISVCTAPTYHGYEYDVVRIGTQCWFAENLRTTTYRDGYLIPAGLTGEEWSSATSGATAVYGEGSSDCFDTCDEVQNVEHYGRLYNWYAVDDTHGLCPNGWHVPTDGEWTTLTNFITSQGFSGTEGTALKSMSGWYESGNGTDDFGFSTLPGGFREPTHGSFSGALSDCTFWSSSPNDGDAWSRYLNYILTGFNRYSAKPRFGFSVRCLKDAE